MGSVVDLQAGSLAFDPEDIDAMSAALDAVCRVLNICNNTTARELIALRIIDLALRGERSSAKLKEFLIAEAQSGTGC